MKKIILSLLLLSGASLAHAVCGVSFFTGPYAVQNSSDHTITITWTSNSESATLSYYVIERENNGSTVFTKIGTMAKQGNTTGDNNYSFTDYYPGFGNPYNTSTGQYGALIYRVRMVTIDNNSCNSSNVLLNAFSTVPSSPSQTDCSTAFIDGPTQVCSSTGLYETVYASSNISWVLDPSMAATVTATGSVVSVVRNGTYSGTLTLTASTLSCGNITKTVYIGAGSPPGLTASYDASCGAFLNGYYSYIDPATTGFNYMLTDMSSGGSTTTYTTTLAGGGNLMLSPFPFPSPPTSGSSYSYQLTISANTSCGTSATSSSVVAINIGPIGDCSGGGNQERAQPVATEVKPEPEKKLRLQLYPNPVSGLLTITLPDAVDVTRAAIRISDISGRQVRAIQAVSSSNSVSLSQLTPGVYIVEIYEGRKRISVQKIIKN